MSAAATTLGQAAMPARTIAPNWHAAAYAARAAVSKVLTEALQLSEEANQNSSGWARRLISNAITSNETSGDDTQFEVSDTACNVEAILQGVLSLPDDPAVSVVRAKVEHAISILEAVSTFDAREIHAAIETAPSVEAATIADIHSWMVVADEKLEQAYDAAERGEPIDTLLDHICHSVIVDPLRLMQRDHFTQFDAKRVYTGLFPVLACIQGAIKLAEGTVLHHTLQEAFQLLDAAQEELDPCSNSVRALPLDDDDDLESSAAPDTSSMSLWNGAAIEDIHCMVAEVVGIMQSRGEAANSNLLYGAICSAERAYDRLGTGLETRSIRECEKAGGPLAAACDVLLAALQEFDDQALHGAFRLLELARARLEEEFARPMTSMQEVQ